MRHACFGLQPALPHGAAQPAGCQRLPLRCMRSCGSLPMQRAPAGHARNPAHLTLPLSMPMPAGREGSGAAGGQRNAHRCAAAKACQNRTASDSGGKASMPAHQRPPWPPRPAGSGCSEQARRNKRREQPHGSASSGSPLRPCSACSRGPPQASKQSSGSPPGPPSAPPRHLTVRSSFMKAACTSRRCWMVRSPW